MRVFWRESRGGRHLILDADGKQTQVGFILRNKTEFDGVAKTTGYAPERSRSGFTTIDEAASFVEAFKPWTEFGAPDHLSVEPTVQPRPA